jgi:hypothetical protein
MQPTETVMLVRYVKALCPQQAIDSYTPDAWHEVLGHLDLGDCQQAVTSIVRRQVFVAPAEIIAEVAQARGTDLPHSQACRSRHHADCRFSWCACTCHPAAVAKLAGAKPPEIGPGARFQPGESPDRTPPRMKATTQTEET